MTSDSCDSVSLAFLLKGDVEGATEHFRRRLEDAGTSPFREASGFEFTNPIDEVRDWIRLSTEEILTHAATIGGLYTENNGLDFNPDCWFADLFGIDEPLTREMIDGYFEPREDILRTPNLTLVGGETMQEAFAEWLHRIGERDASLDRAAEAARYLVHARFLCLVKSAWDVGPIPGVTVPLAATCHEIGPVLLLDPLQG